MKKFTNVMKIGKIPKIGKKGKFYKFSALYLKGKNVTVSKVDAIIVLSKSKVKIIKG